MVLYTIGEELRQTLLGGEEGVLAHGEVLQVVNGEASRMTL